MVSHFVSFLFHTSISDVILFKYPDQVAEKQETYQNTRIEIYKAVYEVFQNYVFLIVKFSRCKFRRCSVSDINHSVVWDGGRRLASRCPVSLPATCLELA